MMAEFVERLDLRDLALIGHDWGGPIGFGAAVQEPDRYYASDRAQYDDRSTDEDPAALLAAISYFAAYTAPFFLSGKRSWPFPTAGCGHHGPQGSGCLCPCQFQLGDAGGYCRLSTHDSQQFPASKLSDFKGSSQAVRILAYPGIGLVFQITILFLRPGRENVLQSGWSTPNSSSSMGQNIFCNMSSLIGLGTWYEIF